ncbi:hypothetical protein ACLMJK_001254 [Lecanora helva]
MASHSLAIAKASLAAGMMRPDPVSISRTEIARFHESLEALLQQCSATNIQSCKAWLLENVIPSSSRIAAIGKYLVALSGSLAKGVDDQGSTTAAAHKPSSRRKQLYILYLLNDLLHHTKYHFEASSSAFTTFTSSLSNHVSDLFGNVSAHNIATYAKHNKKIQDLLDLWDKNGYFQTSHIEDLRARVASAARLGQSDADDAAPNVIGEERLEEKKDAPYIMPASHGDSSTPFYDLPAANMLPHIMPNSTTPINPQLVKPLQLISGPAEEGLVSAVKKFLQDVDSLDGTIGENEDTAMDIDELGQSVIRDEITGDVLEGDGYYGWSRGFCEKMERRGTGIGGMMTRTRRSSSGNRDPKSHRRRYAYSNGSGRSRSRSSSIVSRRDRRQNGRSSMSRSRSRSRSPTRDSRPYRTLRSRSRSRSISRSCSYSPPPVITTEQNIPPSTDPRPLPRNRAPGPSPPQPIPFSHPFPQGIPPLGPGGVPVPPPPPPNYTGPWPPPPPPLSTSNDPSFPLPGLPILPPAGPRVHQSNGSFFQPQSSDDHRNFPNGRGRGAGNRDWSRQ